MKENKKSGIRKFIVILLLISIIGFTIREFNESVNRANLEFEDSAQSVNNNGIIDFTVDTNLSKVVLAVNTHKSIYLENETAFIGIAVLNEKGEMVCDADIILEITDPKGITTILKTPDDIIVTEACHIYDVTKMPDYYTNYTVSSAGIYLMNLTAVTHAGRWNIKDNFTVVKKTDFEVKRELSLTRIYPPLPHIMNINIKANKNYNGIIKEFVPDSFIIMLQEGLTITVEGNTKALSWKKNFLKGNSYNLYYEFDAPDDSPAFYLLGRLRIGFWQEARYWQIASDALTLNDDDAASNGVNDSSVYEGERISVHIQYDVGGGGQNEDWTVRLIDDNSKIVNGSCDTGDGWQVIAIDTSGCSLSATCSSIIDDGTFTINAGKDDDDNNINWTLEACVGGSANSRYNFTSDEITGNTASFSYITGDVEVLPLDYSVNITINGNLNLDKTITYPVNASVNGTCGAQSGTCYLFGNISGTMELLASDNSEPFFVEYNSSLAVGLYNFTVNNTYNASGRSHTLRINKAGSSMQCFINGTRDDFGPYYYPFDVNVTANLTIPTTGIVNISIDGHINDSGASPYTNITNINSLGNFTANCSYEGNQNYSGSSESFWINTSNGLPKILNIAVDDPIDLIPGSATKVTCNATINDSNGFGDIGVINSTLYFNSTGVSAEDDNNNHYSNNSCMNVSKSGSQINVSCSYDVYYYANNGSWSCNITAIDSNNVFGSSAAGTTVNDLLAIDVSPSIIDYGEIEAGDNSSQDFKVNITNLGNIDFNVTLYGYAINDGDNLSMNCTEGYNISAGYHKYSIYQARPYSSMINLSGNASLIANYTLPRRTNDTTYKSDRNYTYWKMGIPYGIQGRCAGFVIFTGVSI